MTTATPQIVETPDAITESWLTATLRHGGHLEDEVAVSGIEVAPLGTGQMCDSWRLSIGYDAATTAPASLVAKLPAADPTSRTTARALRSYEKEVRFYQELAPSLPMRTPRAYHADIDVETAAFTLLLEDMAPASQGDQIEGCSREVADLAVAELVRLHAPRWDDPALLEIEWLLGDVEANRMLMVSMMPTLWKGFCDRYEAELPDHVHRAGDLLFANLAGYFAPVEGGFTIVHHDYRLDNMLLNPESTQTPIAVVDWQTCAVGPGPEDVAYFLGAGLLADDRREVEEDMVRRYHEALRAAGVSGYDWDRCWYDYRRGTWAGLIMTVGASMMVQRTERGDRMFLTMASRHSEHALDLDAVEVISPTGV